jgi:hypothetical protein
VRFPLSFTWTALPDATVVEAIREAALLGLTTPRIRKLQDLRTRILRINSLVQYKANLYPALMLANVSRHMGTTSGDNPWGQDKAALLNNAITTEVKDVLVDCLEILKWLKAEPPS